MKKLKTILFFILILLQSCSVLLSSYALSFSANQNISNSFAESKVEVYNFSSILAVVTTSMQEQLKTITDLACLPISLKKSCNKTDGDRDNACPSNNSSSSKMCFNTVNTNANLLNFTVRYQPPLGMENVFCDVIVISLFWIIEFLILFKLKKLKNYYFILARASIDFILQSKVRLNPVAI